MKVTITIPDVHSKRVIHALCKGAGQPESAQNAKKALIQHIRATVRNIEMMEAEQKALQTITEPDVKGIAE